MEDFEGKTFEDGMVSYTIHRHLTVLKEYPDRETPWRREANIVSWNGGEAKLDIRDWNLRHDRMSRGITLQQDEAEKLAIAIGQKLMNRSKEHKERDSFER